MVEDRYRVTLMKVAGGNVIIQISEFEMQRRVPNSQGKDFHDVPFTSWFNLLIGFKTTPKGLTGDYMIRGIEGNRVQLEGVWKNKGKSHSISLNELYELAKSFIVQRKKLEENFPDIKLVF